MLNLPNLLICYLSCSNVRPTSSIIHASLTQDHKMYFDEEQTKALPHIINGISISPNPSTATQTLTYPLSNNRIPTTPLNPVLTHRQMPGLGLSSLMISLHEVIYIPGEFKVWKHKTTTSNHC